MEFQPTKAGANASKPWGDDVPLVEADVIDETDENTTARHDPVKLSNAIAEAYRKYRGNRRRLPRVRINVDLSRRGKQGQDLHCEREAKPVSAGQSEGHH